MKNLSKEAKALLASEFAGRDSIVPDLSLAPWLAAQRGRRRSGGAVSHVEIARGLSPAQRRSLHRLHPDQSRVVGPRQTLEALSRAGIVIFRGHHTGTPGYFMAVITELGRAVAADLGRMAPAAPQLRVEHLSLSGRAPPRGPRGLSGLLQATELETPT